MKRAGPLKQRAPLVATTSLSRERPRRHPTRRDPQYRKACTDVDSRSSGWCEANVPEACPSGRHKGEHHHHIVLRSRGGVDEAWNLLHVCHLAHDWIHHNPADATARGLMRSRGAA